MRSLSQYLALVRELGAGWLLYRTGYAMRRRSGLLRWATPTTAWEQVPVAELSLHPGTKPAVSGSWGNACLSEAEAVLRGEFRLFSHRSVQAGFPPDWHWNQLANEQRPEGGSSVAKAMDDRGPVALIHWTEISDFAGGDIKGVWELSRFPWAFVLTRAYARTGDAKYAEAFWRLFADWCRSNPPNLGPNWMCGQEATFRLMAVVFAAESFGVPAERREALAQFVVATGRRIAANLDYALSQKNNHGVSECVGLVTAALLVPGHPEAVAWRSRGLRELEAQIAELVYEDGGFSQHSLVYHRVLLHGLCWCRRRLELTGQGIPAWLDAAGKRALYFLMTITDPATGQAPLYGSNDGANVLPLAEGDFLDMRPVIQMASAAFHRELPLSPGPWDEAAMLLAADWDSLRRVQWPTPPARWHAPIAGCFQLTHGCDRLFLRCPTRFRHRPAQADMLHVDVWHGGLPVAMDGGSFSYNSCERFTALGSAALHNAMTIEGVEPIRKFGRFLYLPWPQGGAGMDGQGGFRASHDGYAALGVKWTRTVSKGEAGGWVVHDHVSGAGGRILRWHWRLADRPWTVTGDSAAVSDDAGRYRISWRSSGPTKVSLVRAAPHSAYGWWSPHYGEVAPACSLVIAVPSAAEIDLRTEFSTSG